MLHFFIGLIISGLFISSAWSKCNDNQMKIVRSTTSGLSMGQGTDTSMFGSKVTVNVPLLIDGKPACYHQENSLNVSTKKVEEAESVEYEITPLIADFENVPSPESYQYLNIVYDPENKASKVLMMSFLCSGETPIGADAFSDHLKNLSLAENPVNVNVEMYIATGQAAENISVSQAKKANAKVFDQFLEIYESRINDDETENQVSNIYIPSVLAELSVSNSSSIERKLYSSFFSRTHSSVNGCSKKFLSIMKDYLIENVTLTQPFKGIEIKKKRFSTQYKMKWVL